MSDFGRHGGTDYRDRERRWRDEDRSDTGIFSNDRELRRAGRSDRDSGFFSSDSDSRDFGRPTSGRDFLSSRHDRHLDRDRDRDRTRDDRFRSRSSGGFFGSDDSRSERQHGGREEERNRFGNDDDSRSLPIDETEQLIASNKVEGTPVYGREGERLGTIYNFMVDKYSGRVTYAVMSYGGFLGVGQRYYPLPWRILTYDTHEGGYRVDMDSRDMERAPSFSRNDEPRFNRDYGRRVHNYYGLDY